MIFSRLFTIKQLFHKFPPVFVLVMVEAAPDDVLNRLLYRIEIPHEGKDLQYPSWWGWHQRTLLPT